MTNVTIYTYIGFGVSILAALAMGFLFGGIPRRRKEGEIIAAAEEEAERIK